MAKNTIEQKIDALTSIVKNGFASADKKFEALAGDIARIDERSHSTRGSTRSKPTSAA
jgi:hypothetical protein